MTRKYTAPELIAFHLSWDISEVKEGLYQCTIYRDCKVYVIGEDYMCCPTAKQKMPDPLRWKWEEVGEYHGRKVYWASHKTEGDHD